RPYPCDIRGFPRHRQVLKVAETPGDLRQSVQRFKVCATADRPRFEVASRRSAQPAVEAPLAFRAEADDAGFGQPPRPGKRQDAIQYGFACASGQMLASLAPVET